MKNTPRHRYALRHLFLLMAFVAAFLAGRKSHEICPDLTGRLVPTTDVRIYVVRRNVSAYENVQRSDFDVVYWPAHEAPKTAVANVNEIRGAKLKVAMFTGEPLLRNNLILAP